MIDLSLVPVNELADELVKRGKTAIVFVAGLKNDEAYINWVGEYYPALGLCVDMQRFIIEECKDQ